ncbi:MAG: hypothetical protein AB2L20_06620 [Mangrovibacterium sp.]
MKTKIYYLTILLLLTYSLDTLAQGDGYITKDGKRLFPLGIYYMPKDDQKLMDIANAGFNIIRCDSKEALDRAQSVGLMGWMPLQLQNGTTDEFKTLVNSVVEHPALALWEGPDEVVWNFQAWSGLYLNLKVHEMKNAWWHQTTGSVKYAEEQSKIVIPNMISAISHIRSVDKKNRQVWINECAKSDIGYVRQYLDYVDITGCDMYPIRSLYTPENGEQTRNSVDNIKFYTQRWMEAGRGKPVYMVLQAFSWPDLGGRDSDKEHAFPSFDESRYMAYSSIAYGAKGINYWGSFSVKNEEFLKSICAVVSELSELQSFLVSPQNNVGIQVITDDPGQENSASCFAGRSGLDWMIAVINETSIYQMGVVVKNLNFLDGIKLFELYGKNEITVSNNEIVLRMKPREVKVFATDRKWETSKIAGRDYKGE